MKLYSVKDLAKMTGLKESFIRKLIFRKQITYRKFGRLVRFSQSDIEQFINQSCVPSTRN